MWTPPLDRMVNRYRSGTVSMAMQISHFEAEIRHEGANRASDRPRGSSFSSGILALHIARVSSHHG